MLVWLHTKLYTLTTSEVTGRLFCHVIHHRIQMPYCSTSEVHTCYADTSAIQQFEQGDEIEIHDEMIST